MKSKEQNDQPQDEAYLFMIRVWPEKSADGQRQWRGKMQEVVRGEAQSIGDWSSLGDQLLAMLDSVEGRRSEEDSEV